MGSKTHHALRSQAAILGLFLLALAGQAEARRYALLLGNNMGGNDLDTLQFAESDARRMGEVLQGISGFDRQDVRILANSDSAGLESALEDFRKRLSAPGQALDGMFLFYYSGHADKNGLRLGNKTYPLERLRDNFASVPGQVKIGIFDACQSGLMTRFKGGATTKPISLESLKNIQGQVIIASSAMDERSQESEQLQSSIFTHHWITGLRGSADLSGDRRITLTEAYQYAYQMTIQATSKTKHGTQHPAYQFRIHGEGDIVLADLNMGKTGLVFDAGAEGKYLVMDWDQRSIVADFYKPIGKELLISVSGGNYKVFKVERDQWRMSDTRIASGRVETFKPSTLVVKPQVVNPIKGEIEAGYRVIPGPISYKPPPLGATRRYGLSLKIGESAGPFGFALLYNAAPDMQIQGGYLSSDIPIDNLGFEAREYRTNTFALLRKYEGPYFADAGLNLKTTALNLKDSTGRGSASDWEMGIPMHVGIELGPRRSIFVSMSLGYLWVFTGGGEFVKARTPGGTRHYVHTVDSGLSFGLALGAYLF